MPSFETIYVNAVTEENVNRLAIAIANVVRSVFLEGAGVAEHDLRIQLVNYAGPRTADYERFANEIAITVMANPSPVIDADATDAQYEAVVASLWTSLAKLYEAKGIISLPEPEAA